MNAVKLCSLCYQQYPQTEQECPSCKGLNDFLREKRMEVSDESKSDAEWLEDYRLTYGDLSPQEIMQCQANGVDPEVELSNRRFQVVMSMLLETRKQLRELQSDQ